MPDPRPGRVLYRRHPQLSENRRRHSEGGRPPDSMGGDAAPALPHGDGRPVRGDGCTGDAGGPALQGAGQAGGRHRPQRVPHLLLAAPGVRPEPDLRRRERCVLPIPHGASRRHPAGDGDKDRKRRRKSFPANAGKLFIHPLPPAAHRTALRIPPAPGPRPARWGTGRSRRRWPPAAP